VWCPIDGVSGESYEPGRPFRDVLHTTEVKGIYRYSPSSYFGHRHVPHATIDPEKIAQHLDTSYSAYALENDAGGVETNRCGALQVEIMWTASDGPNLPPEIIRNVKRWLDWTRAVHGTQPVPIDQFHYYLPEDGWRLGFEPWRMTPDVWLSFNGLCGHQHLPENEHGDPGKIPLAPLCPLPPALEDDEMGLVVPDWARPIDAAGSTYPAYGWQKPYFRLWYGINLDGDYGQRPNPFGLPCEEIDCTGWLDGHGAALGPTMADNGRKVTMLRDDGAPLTFLTGHSNDEGR